MPVELNKSGHYSNLRARENALKCIVQEPNFPELTLEEIKFKSKAINTRYAAEIAKVIKPQKKRSFRPTLHLCAEIVLVQSFVRGCCIPRTSVSTIALFPIIFLHSCGCVCLCHTGVVQQTLLICLVDFLGLKSLSLG